jgi:hypothetical protein
MKAKAERSGRQSELKTETKAKSKEPVACPRDERRTAWRGKPR